MFGFSTDSASINYLLVIAQIVLGFIINKTCSKQLNSLSSMTTLVIMPIAPILSLVLFALTRVKSLEYYDGLLVVIALTPMIFILKAVGAPVIVFSIMLTIIVYSCNIKQDGLGSVVIGILICWLSKDMENPISVIISANILCCYVTKRVIGLNTNRFKISKESYDNKGTMYTILGGFLEAAFIGPPSDVISNNKDMMDGISDVLCIINFLANGSMRGSATVVVNSLPNAIIFFSIITIVYYCNTNLERVKECDKVWPPVYKTDVKDVTNLELALVVASLVCSHALTDYMLVGKLVIVVGLFFFVRVKSTTSLFFSTNLIF